jgi:hypothetical protein
LLNARSVMAHAIYLSDEELALFRSTGASISHCPNSNFTICSGVLDVRRVLDAGVKLGLGTDVSGGYAPSMWDAIRMAIVASSVHSVSGNRPEPLGYAEAFYLATLGGARALALGDEIGSLEVGKQFDALLIDPAAKNGPIDLFDGLTTSEVFQKIVFLCDDRNIERVFVCGVEIDAERCNDHAVEHRQQSEAKANLNQNPAKLKRFFTSSRLMTSRLLSWSAEFGYFGSSDSDDDDGDDSAVTQHRRQVDSHRRLHNSMSRRSNTESSTTQLNNDNDNDNNSINASIASNAQQQQRCSRAGTRATAHVGCGECAKQWKVRCDFVHGEHDVVAFVVGHDGVFFDARPCG